MNQIKTIQDHLRAERAANDLGFLLLDIGRYTEAYDIFTLTISSMADGDPRARPHYAGLGFAAFYLGRESVALVAFERAGPYRNWMVNYFQGVILEKAGRMREAISAYRRATGGNPSLVDPLVRMGLLLVEKDKPSEAVAALVENSPKFGRELILSRLETDPEMRPLLEALRASGDQERLSDQRPIVRHAPEVEPVSPQQD